MWARWCIGTLRPVMQARVHRRTTSPTRRATGLARVLAAVIALAAVAPAVPQDDGDALPQRLSGTGLFVAGSAAQVRDDVLSFTPQYTLWSDGADKRRWIRLPAGSTIDASAPDAWSFPPGTQLWKEFSHQGRRVETRYIERQRNGLWRYATYVWDEQGTDALLAPARGIVALPVAAAPQGRYDIPSRADCTTCHEGAATPVLGFSALQLSADRDPLAAHAQAPAAGDLDLERLVTQQLVRNLPAALLQRPLRVPAASATERAALGYLHANCGHCHNRSGAGAPVRLTLAQSASDPAASRAQTLASAVGVAGRYRTSGFAADAALVAPRAPERSVLVARMRSRHAQSQMPPLGTRITDDEGLALVEQWIDHLPPLEESKP